MQHHSIKSGTAWILSFGIAASAFVPFLLSAPAIAQPEPMTLAQLFPQSSTIIPAGTVLPIRYEEGERIILAPDETFDVSFTITQDLYSTSGTRLIPMGSIVEGQLVPVDGGSQFVADTIVFPSGVQRPIDAVSNVVTNREVLTERTNPDLIRGAVIGAAAAAIIAEIFGSISFWEVIGGAGLGVLASILIGGGTREVEVIVIEPETDLELQLRSDFALN
jgi:hypothetical protein